MPHQERYAFENAILRVQRLFEEKNLRHKPLKEMTLEEKGILLQLGVGDPFKDEELLVPDSSMSPEDKGALLLRYITDGVRVFREDVNEKAKSGESWLV